MKREDITKKKFSTVYRGLDEHAVRQHLTEVADELDKKDDRIVQLEEMLNEREENLNSFKSVESSIQEAILSASKAGDEIKQRAQNYSDSIIKKAETEGEQIISRALMRENHMIEHNEDLKRQAKFSEHVIRCSFRLSWIFWKQKTGRDYLNLTQAIPKNSRFTLTDCKIFSIINMYY